MPKPLVIVESPAKAKTIEGFLGRDNVRVIASYGHIRDLPAKGLSVDVDNDLNRAIVTFDSLGGPEQDAVLLEAFAELRVKLQAALGRQIKARKTPILVFRADEVIRAAERIEEILRRHQD